MVQSQFWFSATVVHIFNVSTVVAFLPPYKPNSSQIVSLAKKRASQLNTLLFSSSSSGAISARNIEFQIHPSIQDISADAWDKCLTEDESSSPFLQHSWLRCMEESKCASAVTGWAPQHMSIRIDGKQWGFVPLYLKGHSMGEFIFDNSWADAAHQFGIKYYPKLLVGVPFTPATGQRILFHPYLRASSSMVEMAELRLQVAKFLRQVAASNGISSIHFNFLTEQEATDLAGPLPVAGVEVGLQNQVKELFKRLTTRNDKEEYLRRTSLQYHWKNENPKNENKPYLSFDDYLGAFKSKRRITIRRERKKVLEDENIRIDAIVGKDILKYDGLLDRMFEIYVSTIDKMFWGRQYLTKEFFQLLGKSDFIDNLCFMCARRSSVGEEFRADDVFAGTFNIIKNGVFYGRYWGCLKEVKNLHFETCYWSAIDFCITNGLQRMEPGAGGGDYKWARGFDPALIHSAHYICNPALRQAVAQFLEYETDNNVELTKYLTKRSVVGKGSNGVKH